MAGQRYWSTLLPPDVSSVTSGVWTPDDQHVYLGTSQGSVLVMDIQGNTVGRVVLREGVPVTDLSWNCERFNMEEQSESGTDQQPRPGSQGATAPCLRPDGRPYVLAVSFKNGEILLMRVFDDVIPQLIQTGLSNYFVDWTNSGDLLAVSGKLREIANRSEHTVRYINVLQFYDESGQLLYRIKIPSEMVTTKVFAKART